MVHALLSDVMFTAGLSVVRLYVDRSKVFDTVCRQIPLGQGIIADADMVDLLQRMGLPPELSDEVPRLSSEHGTLLHREGCDPALNAMIHDHHSGSWIGLGSKPVTLDSVVIETMIGARQGCSLGALIFNVAYEHTLQKIRARARAAGLDVEVGYDPDMPPWAHKPSRLRVRGKQSPESSVRLEAHRLPGRAVAIDSQTTFTPQRFNSLAPA